jgi:hypothetical protein
MNLKQLVAELRNRVDTEEDNAWQKLSPTAPMQARAPIKKPAPCGPGTVRNSKTGGCVPLRGGGQAVGHRVVAPFAPRKP